MPKAHKQILGYFQLANDVPGYEEMEFRRPEVVEEAEAGVEEGVEVEVEVGQDGENGIAQTNGNDEEAGRPSGWVEEADEGVMGKVDT